MGKKKRFMLNPKFAKSLDKYKNLKAAWASKTKTKAEKVEIAEPPVETIIEFVPEPSLSFEEKVVTPVPVEVVEVEKPKPTLKKKSAPKTKAKAKPKTTKKATTKKSTRKKK